MLKNGAHVACAPCSIPSALFAQFDLTKHTGDDQWAEEAFGMASVLSAAEGVETIGLRSA